MKERYFVIIWSHDGTRYALNGTNRRDLFKRIRSNFPGSRPFKTAEEKRGRMKGFSAESLMEKRVVHQLR